MAENVNDKIIIGATPKYKLHIEPITGARRNPEDEWVPEDGKELSKDGTSIITHLLAMDFTAYFYTKTNKRVAVRKSEMYAVDPDTYIATVNTTDMDPGILMCRVEIHIPDDEAPLGERVDFIDINTYDTLKK